MERYLGDGLYASFDGYQVRLYTDRGSQGGVHEVFLDIGTLAAFLEYVQDVRSARRAANDERKADGE